MKYVKYIKTETLLMIFEEKFMFYHVENIFYEQTISIVSVARTGTVMKKW